MIGNRLDLAQNTINDRFQSEIPDLEKLIQSRLKIKNPADLIGDAETPVLDLRARTISSQSLCSTEHHTY
jgi:hypothetical protein